MAKFKLLSRQSPDETNINVTNSTTFPVYSYSPPRLVVSRC